MSQQELELPQGWVKSNLENLCELIGGGTPPRQNLEYFDGGILWLTPTEIPKNKIVKIYDSREKITALGLKKSSAKIIPKNSVLLTSRASIGYVAIAGVELTTNQGFVSFVCDIILHNYFLGYWLFGNKNLLESEATGTTFKEISKSKLRELEFKLPPLSEQKRIVSKIEELFSKIDLAKQSLEHTKLQLELYRQSLFKSLFNKTTNFVTLEECSKIGSGGTPSRQKPEYYGGGISWVKTTEVQNSYIQSTSEKITDLGLKNSSAKIYPKNSVVVAMYGEGKTRGKCAILDIDASTNQACAVITCDVKKLLYQFCFYWFQSQYDQMRLKSSGGNQPNLNLGIIKHTQIPLPSIQEQEQIVSQIEQGFSLIENTSQIVNSTLQNLQTMKMSVLKQAFEGKLVPQDPNDEPAQILLEKIKSTKESQSTKQR